MNGSIIGDSIVVAMMAARLERDSEGKRGSGRTTRHALRAALEAIIVGQDGGTVQMGDHSKTDQGNAELALKVSAILKALGVGHVVQGASVTVDPLPSAEQAKAEEQFETPHWAVARNESRALVAGAQLLTKYGRRHGNAWLLNDHGNDAYCVHTEAGNHMHMNAAEIAEGFYVGEWIGDLEEIFEKFVK